MDRRRSSERTPEGEYEGMGKTTWLNGGWQVYRGDLDRLQQRFRRMTRFQLFLLRTMHSFDGDRQAGTGITIISLLSSPLARVYRRRSVVTMRWLFFVGRVIE